jgi:hypothetical protein
MSSHKPKFGGLVLAAATTLVVAACSSKDNDAMSPPPAATNESPTLSAVADQSVNQDTVVGPIDFTIGDRESDASLLAVVATADGYTLVPPDGLVVGGSGAARNITLTPLESATGTVNVVLTVTDPQGLVATRAFRVSVNERTASVRDATLSTFAKAETDEVTAVNGFTFTQDAEDPAVFEGLIGTEEP